MTIAMRVEEVQRNDGEMRLVVEVPHKYQAEAVQVFEVGAVFGAAALDPDKGRRTMEEAGPYYAQALTWMTMFFNKPEVARVLGTDNQYIAWCKTQECCVTGSRDYNDGAFAVDYAHVRRAGAAGTGIKPPFSGVPLCHRIHDIQHRQGEQAALNAYLFKTNDEEHAKRWFDERASWHLARWSKNQFLALQQQNYISNMPPSTIVEWAKDNSLAEHIPTEFKELV